MSFGTSIDFYRRNNLFVLFASSVQGTLYKMHFKVKAEERIELLS